MATTAPQNIEPTSDFVAADTYEVGEQVSLWQDTWRRLRRNKLAVIALVIVALEAVVAIISRFWTPYTFWLEAVGPTYQGPTLHHLMGLDASGRDILSRDYNITIGVFTAYAILVGLVNLLIDLVYPVLDPRIRY